MKCGSRDRVHPPIIRPLPETRARALLPVDYQKRLSAHDLPQSADKWVYGRFQLVSKWAEPSSHPGEAADPASKPPSMLNSVPVM